MTEQVVSNNIESAIEAQRFPAQFKAQVVGKVQHRAGDGPLEEIPTGTEVLVDTAIASYVLSWVEGADPITVTLAKRELEHYVDNGDWQLIATA